MLRPVTERVCEIVRNGTSSNTDARRSRRILRREAVGVVAEVRGIDAAEFDREVGGAAIVLRIEAVGLATGGGADLDHLHVDAAQAVDDRLAGRAGVRTGQHEHARQIQCGQGDAGGRGHGEALGGGMKGYRRDRHVPHRIGGRVLAVELRELKGLARGWTRPGDHVGRLAGDVEVAASVVTDVEHQVSDSCVLQGRERRHQGILCRGRVIVEEHVANGAAIARDRAHALHRMRGDVGRNQRHGALRTARVHDQEGVGLIHTNGEKTRIQDIDTRLGVVVDRIDPVHRQHFRAAQQIGRCARSLRARLGVGHDNLAGWRSGYERPLRAIPGLDVV